MSALRKIKRVGKKASKFQYTATYQSVVVECQKIETWRPHLICVSWSRRGRRFITQTRPWQASPDNKTRGVVIWPEKEIMEVTVTLYKSPKDTSYETKEWEFNVIDVDSTGKRKILASKAINMVKYASTMPLEHDVQLQLKPVSRKIKKVILDITLTSILLKEGKATDDDMMSIASMMSISNLSVIGNLEDDDDGNYGWHGGRSITPPLMPESILSPEELLKWTQEVTAGYRGVKVTNMTTSWRTGMGFLAVIHYYRPDLIDIEAVSPNAIKENNKLAFDLAQHLGISCPLTPSTMISATIPDKLLVSSFLFNMHQYFTRAVPSAIAKDGTQNSSTSPNSEEKPSSPFDISKIHKEFDPSFYNNLSPVHSPKHAPDMTENRYSRHSSRRNSAMDEQEPEGRTIPVASGGYGAMTHTTSLSPALATESTGQRGADPGQDSGNTVQELGHGESENPLDKVVLSSVNETWHKNTVPQVRVQVESNGHLRVSDDPQVGGVGRRENGGQSTEEDRLLEFEGESGSEPYTGSSVSLDGFGEGSSTSLSSAQPRSTATRPQTTSAAVDIVAHTSGHLSASELERDRVVHSSSVPTPALLGGEGGEGGEKRRNSEEVRREGSLVEEGRRMPVQGSGSRSQRRLPTIPADSQETTVKGDERRQKARDLLKKHRISSTTPELFSPAKGKALDSKHEKYREQVRLMLSEFRTPDASHPSTLERREVNSSSSLPETQGTEEKEDNDTLKEGGERGEEGQGEGEGKGEGGGDGERVGGGGEGEGVGGGGEGEGEGQGEGESSSMTAETEPLASEPRTSVTREGGGPQRRVGVVDKPKVMVVGGSASSPVVNRQLSRPRSATTHAMETRAGLTKQLGRANTGVDVSLHEPTSPTQQHSSLGQRKRLPVKELKIKPVQSKPSAAAQKLLQSKREKVAAEVDGGQGGGAEEEEGEMQNGNATEKNQKSGVESPSPWDEHNEGLQQDILMTRNEYVRCELSRLQAQLQNLEKRAVEIESDIRHSMATGNKEDEEAMMQEWFSLLNGKNELIKRQIELNLVEKEEDLEKKQFFTNRELRPLMEIPDEQKTPQQKARTDILVQDLLSIVDERDKLEMRKMATSRSGAHERDGFATAQSHTAQVVHGHTSDSLERHGSRDCVIS